MDGVHPVCNPDSKKILPLLEEFFSRFGYLHVVITDNGPQFVSKTFKEQMNIWNIQHHTTAAYTAKQNPTERQNQVIKNKLRIFLLDNNHKTWDENINKILFSMRNTVNTGTKFSPAELMFRRNIRHPQDLDLLVNSESKTEEEYLEDRRKSLRLQEREAKDNLVQYQKSYTSGNPPNPLENGKEVFLKNHQLSKAADNITASLLPRWIGPYVITKSLGSGVYMCKNKHNDKDIRKCDISQMQLYPNG